METVTPSASRSSLRRYLPRNERDPFLREVPFPAGDGEMGRRALALSRVRDLLLLAVRWTGAAQALGRSDAGHPPSTLEVDPVSFETPEPSLIPPDEPAEVEWTDWSVPAVISVRARTADEAERHVSALMETINASLSTYPGALVERTSSRLPEPS